MSKPQAHSNRYPGSLPSTPATGPLPTLLRCEIHASYTKADLLQRLSNGVLDLSLEQLTEIPPAVFELGAQLTSLDLRGNRITTIPDSVAKLSHLTELYLTRNQLTTIPDSLAQLSQLTRTSRQMS